MVSEQVEEGECLWVDTEVGRWWLWQVDARDDIILEVDSLLQQDTEFAEEIWWLSVWKWGGIDSIRYIEWK